MNIIFVGIGAIGLPMANQISQRGYEVLAVDPSAEAREKANAINIPSVSSFSQTGTADVVVVMVATPEQLENLVNEALTCTITGQTWIIMSTVGPDAIKQQGERLQQMGVNVVDAPVTGGTARAKTGQLVIFTAGEQHNIASVLPILQLMGTPKIIGEQLGQGQGIKVINQHLCSVHIVAAAEALNLAEKLGLDKAAVLDLVKDGAAGSWMLSDRGPRMLLGTDAPVTSTISIFVKDSGLVKQAARACGAQAPLLEEANRRYNQAVTQGLAIKDDSRVIETYT